MFFVQRVNEYNDLLMEKLLLHFASNIYNTQCSLYNKEKQSKALSLLCFFGRECDYLGAWMAEGMLEENDWEKDSDWEEEHKGQS